jgi:hypothetical protein
MAVQMPLGDFPPGPAQALRIVDDYGAIGLGTAQAHSVLAENLQEYLVKGPTLTPGHAYGAANEYIAAHLADQLGLPLLDYRILQAGNTFFFGSSLMPSGTFYPAITNDLFSRCANRDRVYALVVFDVWLCNIDRHDENLIVRTQVRGGRTRFTMVPNDHDRCLVLPGETPADLANKLTWDFAYPFVRLPFIREAIADARRLREAIDSVEGVTDTAIHGVVASLPEPLLPLADRPSVEAFLMNRRSRLRAVFRAGRRFFGSLGEGEL